MCKSERNKRDREFKQLSQGIPRQVKTKRQQGPKRSKPISGNTTAAQKGLTQYGFGLIAVGGTQGGAMKERQQPLREEEEHNRERMSEFKTPVAISATPGRKSGAEGQDSVEAPRTTTSQDSLLTRGDGRRTELVQSDSQQGNKTSSQPYLDLTRDTEPETPRTMRTPHHLAADGEAATQQELVRRDGHKTPGTWEKRNISAGIMPTSCGW